MFTNFNVGQRENIKTQSMFKNYFKKWQKKSRFSKVSDILFLALIIALIIPQGRMAVGGFINRVKSMISQPDLMENVVSTTEATYNWKMESTGNEPYSMTEARGKVVFLNLWATWCPPCVGEMPGIQKLYEKFKDNPGIEFVLVSNEPTTTIDQFMKKKGYTFPVYSSLSETPAAFFTRSIPTTFVLDKSGNIVMKEVGAMNWGGSKMEGILDELIGE
jgi:thiol-disulfide isomerase/thioredoxin